MSWNGESGYLITVSLFVTVIPKYQISIRMCFYKYIYPLNCYVLISCPFICLFFFFFSLKTTFQIFASVFHFEILLPAKWKEVKVILMLEVYLSLSSTIWHNSIKSVDGKKTKTKLHIASAVCCTKLHPTNMNVDFIAKTKKLKSFWPEANIWLFSFFFGGVSGAFTFRTK